MGDEEIIGLFFARSEQAIGETDRKYGAGLRAFSLRILGDRRDVEDFILSMLDALPAPGGVTVPDAGTPEAAPSVQTQSGRTDLP